jgi:DNA-binding MarR family transcriptional regulator
LTVAERNESSELLDTARLLNSAAIHLLRNLRAVDKESGLTPARLSALSVLVFGGTMPLGRLARIEGVTSPTMTRIVDGLEALGLAERRTHPDSARLVMVAATGSGHRLMDAAAERRFAAIAHGLEALPDIDRRAVRAAAAALRDLATRLVSNGPQTG